MSANHAIVAAFAQRLPLVEDLRRQVLQARKKKLLVMSALRAGFVLLAIAAIFSIGWLLSGVLPEDSPLIGVTVLVLMAAAGVLFAMLDSFFSRRFTAPPLPFAEVFRDRVVVPTLHSALPGVSIRATEGLDATTITNSALYLETFKYLESCYGFSGEIGGVPYSGSLVKAWSKRYSSKMGADAVHIHFDGILVHLVRSVPMVGTVRLVDFPSYSGSHDGYTVIRHARVGQARGTIERIDPQAAIILDEGQSTPPALPDMVFRVWMELRQLLGEAFHVSFNETGVYLGMAVRKGRTPMLAASVSPPNRPEDLAEDVELLQCAIKATELLRRLFP